MVNISGNCPAEEASAYVDYLEKKHNRKLELLNINIDGEYVDLNYKFEEVPFERIARITGYLVGNTTRWNDGKIAELKDRKKHIDSRIGGMEQLD